MNRGNNTDKTDASQGEFDNFEGYKSQKSNFASIGMDVFDDMELDAQDSHTNIVLNIRISRTQFDKGVGETRMVPIPWETICMDLRLGDQNAAQVRVARLEALGRIRVRPSFVAGRNGGVISGANLYGKRFSGEPLTTHLQGAMDRRERERVRKQASRNSTPLRRRTPVNSPQSECAATPQNASRRTPVESSEGGENRALIGACSPDKEKTISQPVPSKATACLTGEIENRLRTTLHALGLAPGQISQIIQFPIWEPRETWWIVESIRVGTKGWKLPPQSFMFTALLRDREKGGEWLDLVPLVVRNADWVEDVADAATLEFAERSVIRRALGALRRLPLSPEGLSAREDRLAALPPPLSPRATPTIAGLRSTEEGASLCRNLREALQDCLGCWTSHLEASSKPGTDPALLQTMLQAITFAEEEVITRFNAIGKIHLMSGETVSYRMTTHWKLLLDELVAAGGLDA